MFYAFIFTVIFFICYQYQIKGYSDDDFSPTFCQILVLSRIVRQWQIIKRLGFVYSREKNLSSTFVHVNIYLLECASYVEPKKNTYDMCYCLRQFEFDTGL